MGGERRRRRLRRTGRIPFDAVPEPTPDTEPADVADSEADAQPSGAASAAPTSGDASAAPDLDPRPRPDGGRVPRPTGGSGDRGTGPADRGAGSGGGSSGRGPRPGPPPHQHRPSPADLADLSGTFALTAGVQDPDPPVTEQPQHHPHDHRFDDTAGERGLRGLVGGGSSQVNVAAAMRARDASRPTEDDLATAEAELPIVRRGWVPREELPRTHQ